jgi:hypothetical protein|eukprot:SAG25_NODE_143_length_14049_cov_6.050817_5_plen_56_part_00
MPCVLVGRQLRQITPIRVLPAQLLASVGGERVLTMSERFETQQVQAAMRTLCART